MYVCIYAYTVCMYKWALCAAFIYTCVACDKKLEVPAGPVCMPAGVCVSATPRNAQPAFSPTMIQ